MTTLAPHDIGNRPVITAEVDTKGLPGVSTAVTFTVTEPDGTVTTASSPDPDIGNPSENVWTYQMSVLTQFGPHLIVAQTTAGVESLRRGSLLCKSL